MTPFQARLYDFISNYIATYDNSPSYAQIAHGLGLSPRSKSLISRGLYALKKENKIKLQKEGCRLTIKLTSSQVLLLGKISAGTPIEALPIPKEMTIDNIFHTKEGYALEVKGLSMIEEGIFDGDLIFCRQSAIGNEGDIVVALVDQLYVTLKRLSFKNKPLITLVPANKNFQPQVYAADRVQIQGIYLGLIRRSNSAFTV